MMMTIKTLAGTAGSNRISPHIHIQLSGERQHNRTAGVMVRARTRSPWQPSPDPAVLARPERLHASI